MRTTRDNIGTVVTTKLEMAVNKVGVGIIYREVYQTIYKTIRCWQVGEGLRKETE